jgi:hypothetical protein
MPCAHAGYAAGYPVWVDSLLGAASAAQLVETLRDGAYLSSSQTRALTAEVRGRGRVV